MDEERMRSLPFIVATLCLTLSACGEKHRHGSAPDPTANVAMSSANVEKSDTAQRRSLLSAHDDIHVSVIAVQYAKHWKYIGEFSFSIATLEPRLPDPQTDDFVLVVREKLEMGAQVPSTADLQPGFAYQWLGKAEFHKIKSIDLAKSDEEISRLFGVGAPSNEQSLIDLLGTPPIDQTAAMKLLKVIRNVNYRAPSGNGLLHEAAYQGQLEIVKALIERGANPELPGMNEDTPLLCAAAGGNPAILEILIKKGADIHRVNLQGNSPLHAAAWRGAGAACAKILVSKGANLKVKNEDGNTPLQAAKMYQQFGVNNDELIAYLSSLPDH